MTHDLPSQQPILIITGMHRSGTSLTSALLQSAGLDIGRRLLEANYGNPKGYFENTDVINFHERVLYALGMNPIGWTLENSLAVPEDFIDEARMLIAKNASMTQPWGWKEPRTTLFLNFWNTLLPTARFVFVYRAPWEVIDSLYRRRDDIFYQNPEFALRLWSSYNEAILEFFNRYSERCILVNAADVVAEPCKLINAIRNKLAIELQLVESEIYDKALYRQDNSSQRSILLQRAFPESLKLYSMLNAKADLATHACIPSEVDEPLLSSSAWMLKDWIDLRRAEYLLQAETQRLSGELEQSHQKLGEINHQLERDKEALVFKLCQLQEELHELKTTVLHDQSYMFRFRGQLAQSKALVAYLKNQLMESQDRTHIQIEHLNLRLQKANLRSSGMKSKLDEKSRLLKLERKDLRLRTNELQEARNRIAAMETSKFWKARAIWSNVKRFLGLQGKE